MHPLALLLHREQTPNLPELLEVFLERVHRILRVGVVVVELAQKDQDEQVDHDFGCDDVEGNEVDPGPA